MKCLFIISDAGAGPKSAARALVEEFESKYEDFEYKMVDLLKVSDIPIAKNAPDVHDTMSQGGLALRLYNAYVKLTNSRLGFAIFTAIFRLLFIFKKKRLETFFQRENFDLVINLHAIANPLIQWGKFNKRFDFRYCAVICDLTNIHYTWYMGDHDLLVVTNDYGAGELKERGVKNVKMLGYPIKDSFKPYVVSCKLDAYLKRNASLKVLLFGRNKNKTSETIEYLLGSRLRLEITVVCGNNEELKKTFEARFPEIKALGFVKNISELMAQSDIVISKAGPAVIMETVLMKKPLILTHYISEIERKNVDFVVDKGFGYYCPDEESLVEAVRNVRDEKFELAEDEFYYKYHTGEVVSEIVE